MIGDIITRRENPFLSPNPRNEEEEDEEEERDEGKEGKVVVMPNKQKDDLAQRRAQSRPLPHRDGPMSFVSASMNQSDMQKWERLKMTEPSDASPARVCQACLEKNHGRLFSGPANAGRDHNKVVTFGGVTEIEQPIDTVLSSEGEETELLRRLLPKTTVAMPTVGLGSQLSKRVRSQVDGADLNQTTPPSADITPCTHETPSTPAELEARLAQYEQSLEEEEGERIPDLQKDDMMARRTGFVHKKSSSAVTYNRFLPLPTSKRCTQVEVTTDASPQSKREVQADMNKKLNVRDEHQQPRVPMELPQPHVDTGVIRALSHSERDYDEEGDEYDENEPVPDLEKDDMMARRTRSFQKMTTARPNQCIKQFLPVPGSVKYNIAPVSAMKPLHSKPKLEENMTSESNIVPVQAEPKSSLSVAQTFPKSVRLRKRQELDDKQKKDVTIPNNSVTDVTKLLSVPSLAPPLSPTAAKTSKVESELEKQIVEERVEKEVMERKRDVNEEPRNKSLWLDDDDLTPKMMSRRVAFMSEETESMSLSDMLNEDEVGHLPPLSQSRHEHMHEQYNNFLDEEDHWQNDLARWKNRRRSASQELIKKEEERKRLEKRLKDEGSDSNKRKSIKTYKEIVNEKERREVQLCEDYKNAATPEDATMVLQRYALRFTISDATLDSLKLPRSTSKPKQDPNDVDKEPNPAQPETSEPLQKVEPAVMTNQIPTKPDEIDTDTTAPQQTSLSVSSSTPMPGSPLSPVTDSDNLPPQSLPPNELQPKPTESPTSQQEQAKKTHTLPQISQVQPHSSQPVHALPSPPVTPRAVPLLAAKPYCQPRNTQSGHKPVKMDKSVRVNGEAMEDCSVSTPAAPPAQPPLQRDKDVPPREKEEDVPSEQTVTSQEAEGQTALPQTEKSTTSSSSAISSLIGGRNCIITTTIVTELTQTLVEPYQLDAQSNRQVSGTFGSSERLLASPNSMQEHSPTVTEGLEESSVTEQYQREQEKLKKEWEKAQLEVVEEERKHNEEERRILEETGTTHTPTGPLKQQADQTGKESSDFESKAEKGNISLQQKNGSTISTGKEDQHTSKLHFFHDSASDIELSKKQELWKTASLDRNPQLNQEQFVKRSESHNALTNKQQSSSSSPQPPSPSRCVSGKRLCSGCSQPLGKGAAMIIDTLGLFFHMECFKCGVCKGQLGDATAGTDVRIRNGLLSCHDCYIASRGKGQPTTL